MRFLIPVALSTGLFAGALSAQSSLNVDLLGSLDQHTKYSDIWGYAAPNGKEYALLAAETGTAVIDCSNPAMPVERGFITGPTSDLRDIKTYGAYAYVVSERGGGFQIIDLTNPDSPVDRGTWGAAQFTHAHNIAIDKGTGWIYALGTDVGTVVYDASSNPLAPTFVGIYGSANVLEYVHDMAVQDGIAHAAMVWGGQYRLINVSSWPFTTIKNVFSASQFTHNIWPNETNDLVVTTDEQEGGVVQFWDVSDPSSPTPLSVFSPDTLTTPHNAFLVGGLCHVSWYTAGYRLIDVSDPANPVEVGFHDDHVANVSGNFGYFGCYPFQPSGLVYISDRDEGLKILRPHDLRLHHDALGDTVDEDGPYTVLADVSSSAAITGVQLWWSTDGENYTSVPMSPTANPGEFSGDIPGQLAPRRVYYYLTAADAGGGSARFPAPPEVLGFDVGQRITVYLDDFEVASGWTHGATSGVDEWERGAPRGLGGYSMIAWVDPMKPVSGSSIWGTDIGLILFADGRYQDRTSCWLQSPAIPTQGVQGLRLNLWRWLSIEFAPDDDAVIRVNGQVVWQNPTTQPTQDVKWHEMDIDVSAITDGAPTATIRFELLSDSKVELGGWNIDDVELYTQGDCVPPKKYGAGTAGTGGFVPSIDLSKPARINENFDVVGGEMLGGTGAALLVGGLPASIPVLGVTLLVDLTVVFALPAQVTGNGAGNGTATIPLAVPNDVAFDDADLYTQWLVIDGGSPSGPLATSEGMRIRVCRK